MRKFLMAGVAILALGAASPALAQSETGAAVGGGAAGAATGGTIGFFLGGPVGAIIGGFAGAVIGAEAAVSAETVAYSANNPVDPIWIEGDLDVGSRVGDDVVIYDVDGDPEYGYFYANNRVWIVGRDSREVVLSPGYVIPESTVAYMRSNPSADISFDGELVPGASFSGNVEFNAIPDNSSYAYVYVDGRPVLVDRRSSLVVWVG